MGLSEVYITFLIFELKYLIFGFQKNYSSKIFVFIYEKYIMFYLRIYNVCHKFGLNLLTLNEP